MVGLATGGLLSNVASMLYVMSAEFKNYLVQIYESSSKCLSMIHGEASICGNTSQAFQLSMLAPRWICP